MVHDCKLRRSLVRVPPAGLLAPLSNLYSALAGRRQCIGVTACFAVTLFVTTGLRAASPELTFWKDIRPILRKNCTACHSRKNVKELDVSGGLALDSYDAVRAGAKEPSIR